MTEATSSRAAWMQEGPLGVMVHYLGHIHPFGDGPRVEDWDEMVDAFDLDRFCDAVVSTGAKWLIFTIGQNAGTYCSPNEYLESILPGRCSRRDLVREVAERVKAAGLRMIAYLTTAVCKQSEEVRRAFAWDADPVDKTEFMKRYAAFVEDYSRRLGTLLDGWWFDGCYEGRRTDFTYGNERFRTVDWFGSVRRGNPAAAVAMNPGCNSMQYVFEEEDYLGGELSHTIVKPGRPTTGSVLWHGLLPLEGPWMHVKPGPPEETKYETEALFKWVYECHANGGAVTLNLLVDQSGGLNPRSLEQVTEVAARVAAVRRGDAPAPRTFQVVRRAEAVKHAGRG